MRRSMAAVGRRGEGPVPGGGAVIGKSRIESIDLDLDLDLWICVTNGTISIHIDGCHQRWHGGMAAVGER